jgi:hypothetical protein
MTPVTSAGKAGVRERIPDKSWLSNRFEAQSGGLGQGRTYNNSLEKDQ